MKKNKYDPRTEETAVCLVCNQKHVKWMLYCRLCKIDASRCSCAKPELVCYEHRQTVSVPRHR